jgi:hypothetical protein
LAPVAEGDEDGFNIEPVFRTVKCLGFVSCTHLELDTNGTPSAGGRCLAPVSELQVLAEAMKHTATEWQLEGSEVGDEGAKAALRPGESERDGRNFPPKL